MTELGLLTVGRVGVDRYPQQPGPLKDAAHARSLGCTVEDVPAGAGVDQLRAAYLRARQTAKHTRRPVVVCRTHPSTWTEAGAWWETGVPRSLAGRASYDEGKQRQVRWL